MSEESCKLYLISPPKFDLDEFSHELHDAFAGGEISVFQLRMKTKDAISGQYILPPNEDDVIDAIERLMPICKENDCVFVLNDNPQLALKMGCGGVHLGEDDETVKFAKELLGKNTVVGASCYASKDKAFSAAEQGADYVAFGAFFETQTKTPKGRPTTDLLKFWTSNTTLPCVAIGGIKVDNAQEIVEAGADFIAVVTGVWDYEKGTKAAVKEFNKIFEEYSPS